MLFSESDYIEANEINDVVHFDWPKYSPEVSIHFALEQQTAVSLPRSPYSGFLVKKSILDYSRMIADMLDFSKNKGVQKVIIKQSPRLFVDDYDMLKKALIDNGFLVHQEINHHVVLSDSVQSISAMQKRRIKKCQNIGLVYQTESANRLEKVHDFITRCRVQQNLAINITLDRLKRLFEQLPSRYLIRSIRDDNQGLYAVLIAIKVNRKVVYSYLPAFDRQYRALSPLALLFHEFYQEMRQEGFEFIDLGISSENGKPQDGLIRFKEGMGGVMTYREEFKLDLT